MNIINSEIFRLIDTDTRALLLRKEIDREFTRDFIKLNVIYSNFYYLKETFPELIVKINTQFSRLVNRLKIPNLEILGLELDFYTNLRLGNMDLIAELSDQLDKKIIQVEDIRTKAKYYRMKSEFHILKKEHEALFFLNKSRNIYRELGEIQNYFDLSCGLITHYIGFNKIHEAKKICIELYNEKNIFKFKLLLLMFYNNYSIVLSREGNLSQAEKFIKKAIEISKKLSLPVYYNRLQGNPVSYTHLTLPTKRIV